LEPETATARAHIPTAPNIISMPDTISQSK
jgi:hypothetical protein